MFLCLVDVYILRSSKVVSCVYWDMIGDCLSLTVVHPSRLGWHCSFCLKWGSGGSFWEDLSAVQLVSLKTAHGAVLVLNIKSVCWEVLWLTCLTHPITRTVRDVAHTVHCMAGTMHCLFSDASCWGKAACWCFGSTDVTWIARFIHGLITSLASFFWKAPFHPTVLSNNPLKNCGGNLFAANAG